MTAGRSEPLPILIAIGIILQNEQWPVL